MKILVLAGGFDQIALIQELKKRGHSVILADYYENPPAKPYADEHFQVSTTVALGKLPCIVRASGVSNDLATRKLSAGIQPANDFRRFIFGYSDCDSI